ncbi:zinc ABC transporter substrate-binding protein [Candidatus Bathyarchaeota archaeon]|nr:zinc ABC transporter substrate-binding protein [Candidatus Bathyarchaeota archaeon]
MFKKRLLIAILIMASILNSILFGCSECISTNLSLTSENENNNDVNKKPLVVCTTTVLSSIVMDLAKDEVSVDVISSPAVCPAHYDVRPSDVEAFKHASLILKHGFEPWVEHLKEASGSKAPVVRIKGEWNSPETLKKMYMEVSKALEDYLGIDVSDRLDKAIEGIDLTESWLKETSRKEGFEGKPVVCMLFQKNFISFLGFKIVAVYGPPEKVSARQYESIIKNATKFNAVLVIDNLQSGTEMGKKVASEVGAVEVALTNFPQVMPELNNMTQVMRWNIQRIIEALKNAEVMGEVNVLKEQIETWKIATIAVLIVSVVEAAVIAALLMRLRK